MGLIIGLSIGIPCGMIVIIGVSIAAYNYSRKKEFNQNIDNLEVETEKGKKGWQENRKAENHGTVWTDNISDNI